MGSPTLLRGLRVSVDALDAFLRANGVPETKGVPPLYYLHPDNNPVSKLLHFKIANAGGTADKAKFRVVILQREGHNSSSVAYVTYAWAMAYARREIRMDKDLPAEVPAGFEELKREILSFSTGIEEIDKTADEGTTGLSYA